MKLLLDMDIPYNTLYHDNYGEILLRIYANDKLVKQKKIYKAGLFKLESEIPKNTTMKIKINTDISLGNKISLTGITIEKLETR